MQRIARRIFNTINYVVGGGIDHLFIDRIVNLFAKTKIMFNPLLSLLSKLSNLLDKIDTISTLLAKKQLVGLSLHRCKQSFSLVTLVIYLIVSSLAISITLGAVTVIDSARVSKTIDEIVYYQNANSEFIARYSALPGLVSYSECRRIAEFNDVCRNQNDINLTTSENVYKSTTNNCHHDMGCIIETNGKAGNEDIMRNFLLPMRYLKTAELIDTIKIGLETELDENTNYSELVWAKSRIDKDVYVNIYNYYNPTRDTSKPFLFTGQNIFGHTINSGTSLEHHGKLSKSNNQYLIYLKKSNFPRGAISSKVAHKIDRKIDDGKPMTGRLTTFSTSTFDENFESSEYAGCITAEPNDKDTLTDIEYNKGKSAGYCNIAFQLQNFSSTVIENEKTTLLADTKYENGTRYKTYSDGTIISNDKTDEETKEGYEVVYTYEDGTTVTMRPTCSCNSETKILLCQYEDSTTKSFYPIGDVCTYNSSTGKQICTYEDGSTCEIDLDKNDYQNNCTLNDSTMTCSYTNTGAVPVQQSYTTTKKDCENNVAGEICTNGAKYNCNTFNNKIIGTCLIYGVGYCNTGNVGSNCNDGSGNPASHKCGTLGEIINTTHNVCVQKSSKSCENNSGECAVGYNYVCDTFVDEIYGTCQETSTADCENDSGTCTAGNKNKCKVLNNDIVSGSCQAYSFSDCGNDASGQACQSGSTHYCRLFDNKIVDCQNYAYNQECSNDNGTCEHNNNASWACTTLNGVIKAGTCKEISYKYCKSDNSDCQTSPTSTAHTNHCKFYGDTNTGSCTTATSSTKDCKNNTSGETCTAGSVVANNFSCQTVNNIIAGTCDEYQASYCKNNTLNEACTTGSEVDGNYYCITLNNKIKKADEISHKYCKNSNGTTCASTPQDTTYTNHCKFYGDTNTGSCETVASSTKDCKNDKIGKTCTAGSVAVNNFSCPTVNNIIAGTCDKYVAKDCQSNSGTCANITSGNGYHCPTVLEDAKTIKNSCDAISANQITPIAKLPQHQQLIPTIASSMVIRILVVVRRRVYLIAIALQQQNMTNAQLFLK